MGGKAFPVLAVVALAVYAPLFAASVATHLGTADQVLVNDVGRLNPTRVHAVVQGREVEALQEVLATAREEGLAVSIAGKRHSMGGHAFYPGAVVLDMTAFNKVLRLDVANRTVTAQSGCTWKDVIEAANPHDLSVGVMQAYNGFTLGGSLSVNVHESDPSYGPLVETVRSFRLLLANGTVVEVDRERNAELFGLVVGGYGLFGVILDVTLELTENRVLRKHEQVVGYRDYLQVFRAEKERATGGQVFARLSIAPGDTLLREVVVTTYADAGEPLGPATRPLEPPGGVLKKVVFGLSRSFDWGKDLRWYLQKEHSDLVDAPLLSRNNLMNGDLAFLDYASATRTDILQEYFVPVERLPDFVDRLRTVVGERDLNLLSATIRYIPVNDETVLSYSARESFGVVLYFNVGTSARAQAAVQEWTRGLVDDALALGGTFYLPYETYATREQLRAAYPRADEFFAKKLQHDPRLLFRSTFHETYA